VDQPTPTCPKLTRLDMKYFSKKGRTQMTTHRLLGACILNCSAICALVLTVPEFARAQDCFTRIDVNNPDYLEVTVDTHGIGSNVFLENVSFDITFRVRGTDKKTSYDFTGDDLRSLAAEQVYRRYLHLPSGIGLQVQIVAGNFEYSKVVSGAKSDAGTPNSRERKPIRRSHPPEPGKVVGDVPPRFWP
jgi:hypothetical protein